MLINLGLACLYLLQCMTTFPASLESVFPDWDMQAAFLCGFQKQTMHIGQYFVVMCILFAWMFIYCICSALSGSWCVEIDVWTPWWGRLSYSGGGRCGIRCDWRWSSIRGNGPHVACSCRWYWRQPHRLFTTPHHMSHHSCARPQRLSAASQRGPSPAFLRRRNPWSHESPAPHSLCVRLGWDGHDDVALHRCLGSVHRQWAVWAGQRRWRRCWCIGAGSRHCLQDLNRSGITRLMSPTTSGVCTSWLIAVTD